MKNIVVFADGTGNSAAKLFKTNVWRLYQALDTSILDAAGKPTQVAYYDDGVGTSSLRPLAILGGAFGWGLKRNVLDCYKFICRNYDPGDRIYLFGFSRGAFTVRVLAGLICREGLVSRGNQDLDLYSRDAYRAYRRRFNQTGGLVRWLRYQRDHWIARRRRAPQRRYSQMLHTNWRPTRLGYEHAVEFIGVWDTVAAYGLPIAEMTRGIDNWVWPLSMPDYRLSPKVKAARHALALDDERDTFHPLLWNEFESKRPERIKQVWFAGMHSDVGGGYPEDRLSFAPLEWMLAEATGAGLVFAPAAVAEIRRMASATGPIHDSRRGLASYYRYQPRKISAHISPPDRSTRLMQDPNHPAARLHAVNIHQSVLHRIAGGADGYAPIVVNGAYNIVPSFAGPLPPQEAAPLKRETDQERVWDRVWQRRVLYFASLGVSICLALFPLWAAHRAPCTGPQCLLAPVISSAGEFLPGFVQPWIRAYAANPGSTLVLVAVLALLLRRSGVVEARLRSDMRNLWGQSLPSAAQTTPVPPPPLWIRRLRCSDRYQRAFQFLKWKFLPGFFGLLFLFLIIGGFFGALGAITLRGMIWVSEAIDGQCPIQTTGGQSTYATRDTCVTLVDRKEPGKPFQVTAGERYRIKLEVSGAWVDKTISTSPEGFGPTRMSFGGNFFAPFRRSPSALWFQPLAKIAGSNWWGIRFYRIVPLEMTLTDAAKGMYATEFIAPISGDAQFFVNDVLLPHWWSAHDLLYNNNQGATKIDIELLKRNDIGS